MVNSTIGFIIEKQEYLTNCYTDRGFKCTGTETGI